MKKAQYVFGFLDTNARRLWQDFSESSSKSMSSCQSNLNSELHDGSKAILDCRNAAPAALSPTAAQISQLPENYVQTALPPTISQQKHCHCKEINNDYSVGIPFLIMQFSGALA